MELEAGEVIIRLVEHLRSAAWDVVRSHAMLCHLLALTLSSSIVVADHRECGPYSQDADTTGNQ